MIANYKRLFDRGQVIFGWQNYIPFIEGDLRRHSNGGRIMMQVLAAVPIAGFDPVLVAVKRVLVGKSERRSHLKCSRPTPRYCTAASRRNQPATQDGSRRGPRRSFDGTLESTH